MACGPSSRVEPMYEEVKPVGCGSTENSVQV